ncbi:class I SAM-dependent rRNA methyltransferase [Streptococcus acidominimus]|uniref:Class I SAM-dependent rRNA methyltransferase n=1 Tax=Streptococcus acidominimus TaxID=1326 RepID=A0A4Y9FS58_STRAI|nr:class I SAM-dependent rRNA methyltransferase [Streptococcus acidominimus]MBF0818589.1 class I SAM-dependent rRNA methyltransferase [Streptococcus acidominimus]MBF0838205.1 class I SAM-dependent rRNA methyltransferase [Streptococcus acidominimus]MBF0849094.1 class I SAM-dependent rRNA methyltransferase [Streptococcus danieliae]TFU31088.1 class I SAM-dependent rRNA methyltransferase [Streptococcus acidominimus]
MIELTVSPIVERKIKQGICVLEARDFPHLELVNRLVHLVNQQGKCLGQAYLSAQNKGIGWLISREKVPLDQAFFQHLFGVARTKRQAFEVSDLTTAYRLFHQDGDGFGGLTIDRYNDYAVFSWYNEYIYSIKEEIVAAFQAVYPDILGAYEKIRFKGLDYESAHLYGEEAPETFTIHENGVAYQVFLNTGLMTGIFLDQHEVRGALVDGLAAGKSLLNMFSYTAAFSVAAALGGASQTTSVDLAKRSQELSEAHFKANGLAMDNHRFLVMDVFAYFKYAKRKGLSYDVIVLDPPSFARNKKQTFSVAKDYHRLIAQSLDILNPNGILVASTNASNLPLEKFKKEIEKGFGSCKHRYLETYRLPGDFVSNKKDESSNYLKVFTIQVKK